MKEEATLHILAMITCHNRREHTIRCLRGLGAQAGADDVFRVTTMLVDAASSDGTAEAVRDEFPNVNLIEAPDTYYWGMGMQAAQEAFAEPVDYYFWLNDDVILAPRALLNLLQAMDGHDVVVGQCIDALGRPSYGGLDSPRDRPLSLSPCGVADVVRPCVTFNGNVVLVSRRVAQTLGPVDGTAFPHAMGDIDYGFRATRAGFRIGQCPGVAGSCERNPAPNYRDALSRAARLKAITSIKHLPVKPWWTLCRRHAGWLAPAYFVKPYLEVLRKLP